MDHLLLEYLSDINWQWINFASTFVGGMMCAWLCFWRMDPDSKKYSGHVTLYGFSVPMSAVILTMRANVAMLGCSLGIISVASIEAIEGYAPMHTPTEALSNLAFAFMMMAVTLFHVINGLRSKLVFPPIEKD